MKASDFPLVRDGCISYRDVTGQRFGKLVVVSREIKNAGLNGRHKHWWKCQCDCGRTHYTLFDGLIREHTISCGCENGYRTRLCPAFKSLIIDHRVNTKKSASEIGAYFGITKNSVMGILDRADMCEPKTPDVPPVPRIEPWFPPSTECAYPNGTPWEPGFTWCCSPVKVGSSFCPEHHALCYVDESTLKKPSTIATADFTKQDISKVA